MRRQSSRHFASQNKNHRAKRFRDSRAGKSIFRSFEPLEKRWMLSLTPTQVNHAYGIDQITFSGIKGDGTGQTIAILDEGDDAALVDTGSASFNNSDLHQFDVHEGVADPTSFKVVGESGARPSYIGIASSSESGNTVTINTSSNHGLSENGSVVIAEDGQYDGSFNNIHVVSPTQFTYTDNAKTGLASSTGGTINNPVDTGETTLDVEWAHSIAPGANIILIEINSLGSSDVSQGVSRAVGLGVSVVSMSFGGGEYGQEVSGPDPQNDTIFQHAGITFVASTGDNGEPGGYPAFSPDVLAVGGTNLLVNPDNTYNSETGWSNPTIASATEVGNTVTITTSASTPTNFNAGQTVTIAGVANSNYDGTFTVVASTGTNQFTYTLAGFSNLAPSSGGTAVGNNNGGSGGGISTVESEPAYQNGVQSSGKRETPDVSFVGGEPTPVFTYDSDGAGTPGAFNPGDTFNTWGTSLSAPCWAGLIAIVDQGLALAGSSLLTSIATSANSVQKLLYNLPSIDFHDVTSGNNGAAAGTGYDLVTGLGSPRANILVPDLAGTGINYTVPTTAGPHQLILRKNGANIELLDNGAVVETAPAAAYSGTTITDNNTSDDSLTVDYQFTSFFAGPVTFNHTTSTGYDTVTVKAPNGPSNTIVVNSDPSITVDGSPINAQNISEVDVDTGSGGDNVDLDGSGASGLQKVFINGGTGKDTVDVDSTAGLFATPAGSTNGIFFNGGGGFNTLQLTQTGGTAQTSDTYTVGPNPGEGSDIIVGPGGTQSVFFQSLAPVLDNVPATTVTVNGTPAANAINYTQGPGGGIFGANTTGLVTIDNQESYEFSNKAHLIINGLAGSDEINLNDPTTPTGLTDITVSGNDPTASDTLIVNAETASTAIAYHVPGEFTLGNITGAQTVPVIFDRTIENVTINGQQLNDHLTVTTFAGFDQDTLTPGSAVDSGTIVTTTNFQEPFSEPPLTFVQLGAAGGSIAFADDNGSRADTLIYNGTATSDHFNVSNTGVVTLNLQIPVNTGGISNLILEGLAGDDTFALNGAPPFPVTVDGGDPSASDIVNLSGATGAVGVNIADSAASPPTNTTITGYGSTVTLIGVEVANLSTNGNALTANGYSSPNLFTYTPTGAAAGTFTDAGVNTTFNFTGTPQAGGFTLVGNATNGDGDQVIVNGTNNSDFILVDSPNRNVWVENAAGTDLQPVHLATTIEQLQVNGKLGTDTFYVVPAPAAAKGTGGGATTTVAGTPVSVPINLLIDIEGGAAPNVDELVVGNFALGAGANPVFTGTSTPLASTGPAANFVVVNHSLDPNAGVVRIYRPVDTVLQALPDITYHNVGNIAPLIVGTNLLILGPDQYEQDDTLQTAAFLGSGATINAPHEAIFPNVLEHRFAPADQDYYRVVAQSSGTLDFQVYFRLFSAALFPAGGTLDVQAYDANGNKIADGTVTTGIDSSGNTVGPTSPVFGLVGPLGNADVRVPVVAGQSYYFRVVGYDPTGTAIANLATAGQVVNGYDITVVNTPAPVPSEIELSRSVPNGEPGAPAGTPDTGDLPANAAPNDTGRSQFDNVTKVNNPTIYVRVDDSNLLFDVPGNQTPGGITGVGAVAIPFNPSLNVSVAGLTGGFRVALFDGGNGGPPAGVGHTVDPNDPTFLGFAQPVPGVPHLYALTLAPGAILADGLHNITAEVQMIDPSTPGAISTTKSGFGPRSTSLQITVDTVAPPVQFGGPGFMGLVTDTGVLTEPPTLIDLVTSSTTPTFDGLAEANSVVRVYAQITNPANPNFGLPFPQGYVLLGETVAIPVDGTNAFPNGQWTLTSAVNLISAVDASNNPFFLPTGGPISLVVTAEDLAGNVAPGPNQPGFMPGQTITIEIDIQGPQITDVVVSDPTIPPSGTAGENLDYNLF
ncbi:MAG TPA: hypothetical protein VFE46_07015, partial [Pirellulales bacterium]|nr:hypothetical protein [Pirellulales bacterium]